MTDHLSRVQEGRQPGDHPGDDEDGYAPYIRAETAGLTK